MLCRSRSPNAPPWPRGTTKSAAFSDTPGSRSTGHGQPRDPGTCPGRTVSGPPLAVYAGDHHVATVAAQDHADLSAILDTGLAIAAEITGSLGGPALSITLPLADTAD